MIDDVLVTIDQMQTEKGFEFASIDLIKKSSTTSTSYSETMLKNFQQLEKTIELKMTKLITERFENKSIQKKSVLKTSRKSDSVSGYAKSLFKFERNVSSIKKDFNCKNILNVFKISHKQSNEFDVDIVIFYLSESNKRKHYENRESSNSKIERKNSVKKSQNYYVFEKFRQRN